MLLLVLVACGKPPAVATPTLDGMSSTLVAEFESEDITPLVQPLADWLVEHVDDQDGYELALLTPEQGATMQPQPADADVAAQMGIGVTHRVLGTLDQHVAVVPEADQSFADPRTYEQWDRQITEGTGDGYVAGEPIRTTNQIEKGAMGVTIPYPMEKDYRWVELTQGHTSVFRSWSTEAGCSDNGKNCLHSGFTIELWVPDDAGLIWFNASWADLDTEIDSLVEVDFLRQEVIDGTIDYMDGTAEHATGADQ